MPKAENEDIAISHDKKMWTFFVGEELKEIDYGKDKRNFLVKKVKKQLKSGSKILEIGFGTGDILRQLCEKYECYGVDISLQNIEKLSATLPKVKLSLLNKDGKLPYSSNHFDAFIASEVLEHMTDRQLEICLKEMRRVLRPSGCVFLTFPAEEELKKEECFCPRCNLVFHRFGHKQTWDGARIRSLFNGFARLEIIEYFHKFPSDSNSERMLSLAMWLAQKFLSNFTKFPNRIFGNRTFVVILEK